MDKIKACLERIEAIRGVNYGLITHMQLKNVFETYELNSKQKRAVLMVLKNKGVTFTKETENAPTHSRIGSKSQVPVKVSKDKNERIRNSLYKEKLKECRQDMSEDPSLANQYKEEIDLLRNVLSKQNFDVRWNPSKRITNAIMYISNYRAREHKKRGWMCGTYLSRLSGQVERWVKAVFSQEDLWEILEVCKEGGRFTAHQIEMLTVLLHNKPCLLFHRKYTDVFEN